MNVMAATDYLARSTTFTSVGIIGALIGGFILSFFVNTAGGGLIFTFFTALLGALLLLWIVGMVRRT